MPPEPNNTKPGRIKAFLKGIFERHAGIFFSLIGIGIGIVLFGSRSLDGVEDYLHAFYLQAGYAPDRPRSDILVIKKDEFSSELIQRNPNRSDFASIIRALSRPHFVKFTSGGRFAYYDGLELNFGLLRGKGCPVVNSLGESERTILHYQAKESGEKPPPRPEYFSFFSFIERLWTHSGTSVMSTFDLPKAEKSSFPLFPKDAANPEKELLEAWETFFIGLLRGYVEVDVRADLNAETKFSLRLRFNRPGLPPGIWVTPASVIAWDFVLQGIKEAERNNDLELSEAIDTASVPIVLAAQVSESTVTEQKMITEGPETGRMTYSTVKRISQIMPEQEFVKKTAELGFINIGVTGKGNATKILLFVEQPDSKNLQPSFSLVTSALALDRKNPGTASGASYLDAMKAELVRITEAKRQGTYKGGFRLKDIDIPCDAKGYMTVNFIGSVQRIGSFLAMFPAVSFYECFDEEHLKACASAALDPKQAMKLDPAVAYSKTLNTRIFADMICLAGPFEATDFDFYPTPLTIPTPFSMLKENLMGIEIHANAIQNILDRKFLRPAEQSMTLVLLVLGTILLGFLLDFMSPGIGAVLMLASCGGMFLLGFHSYHAWGKLMAISPCLISFPITWVATVLTNYFRQRAKANTTKAMFARFVSKDVVQYMLEHPDLVRPGGQKVEMTVFFSDVAGFTSISEALTPEELVVLLNEYLGTMTDILFKYGGTLDKFIGDAVMAFWNFPKGQPDHAVRACLCALEMQATITELQKGWAKRGLPKVAARCGMNTAHVVVGYMGSIKAQMNFTCMGDGVNLASRLEGANKEYGTMMMISDATYQQAKERVTVRFLDFLAVKGKKEPVKVHELVCEKGKEPPWWSELSDLYDTGIKLHLDRKWDEAIATFEEVLARWPDDGPSKTYIGRCQEYKTNPPPENWDGSYHLTHK